MEGWQWFLLGIAVAYTPGMVVLALLLCRDREDVNDRG